MNLTSLFSFYLLSQGNAHRLAGQKISLVEDIVMFWFGRTGHSGYVKTVNPAYDNR